MSDSKLFSLAGVQVSELPGSVAELERDLQLQIEANMPTFLGVRFLASEYSTGKTHKGRIDSLGIDENGCPVIIEYKRSKNENVINQGLFYLDWLLDHQAEFKWLVMDVVGGREGEERGRELADNIEWGGTRLICIAADFNKYDEHAVQQINRNIELMRYRYFGDDLLLLELVNVQSASAPGTGAASGNLLAKQLASPLAQPQIPATETGKRRSGDKTQAERLAEAPPHLLALYQELCEFTENLGDEVQRKELKLYTAFKRIKNFASIVIALGNSDPRLLIYLKLPGTLAEQYRGARDVSTTGHWGTGDFELLLRSTAELEQAKDLITQSYQRS